MNILITGGCGFIGSHLAEYHLTKGDQVLVVDELSTGRLENIASFKNHAAFQFQKADILNWPQLKEAVRWANQIYHMAAIVGVKRVFNEPLRVLEVNINGTEILLEAIVETKTKPTVVIASSSSVYGNSAKQPLNEKDHLTLASPTHALTNYAISKLVDETLGIGYYQAYKLPIILVRLFNTIGSRQTGRYGMVVPRFIQEACNNEVITIYDDGNQTRNFCDIRDIVVALDIIANNPKCYGEIINVGHDREITINDLARMILNRTGSQSKIQHISYQEVYGENSEDIKRRHPDLTKFYAYTNFKHQFPLEKTIDDLITDYKNQRVVKIKTDN